MQEQMLNAGDGGSREPSQMSVLKEKMCGARKCTSTKHREWSCSSSRLHTSSRRKLRQPCRLCTFPRQITGDGGSREFSQMSVLKEKKNVWRPKIYEVNVRRRNTEKGLARPQDLVQTLTGNYANPVAYVRSYDSRVTSL